MKKVFYYYLLLPFGIYFVLTIPYWTLIIFGWGIKYAPLLIMIIAILTIFISEIIRQKYYHKNK